MRRQTLANQPPENVGKDDENGVEFLAGDF
jgi:hypothetical protein